MELKLILLTARSELENKMISETVVNKNAQEILAYLASLKLEGSVNDTLTSRYAAETNGDGGMGGDVDDLESTKLRGVSAEGGASVLSPEKKGFRERPASEHMESELKSLFDDTTKG